MSGHSTRRRWAAGSGCGPLFRPGMPRRELAGSAGPQEGRAGQGWPPLGPSKVPAAAVESAGLPAGRHTLEFVLCCAETEEKFVFLATANKFAKSLIPCMCNFYFFSCVYYWKDFCHVCFYPVPFYPVRYPTMRFGV